MFINENYVSIKIIGYESKQPKHFHCSVILHKIVISVTNLNWFKSTSWYKPYAYVEVSTEIRPVSCTAPVARRIPPPALSSVARKPKRLLSSLSSAFPGRWRVPCEHYRLCNWQSLLCHTIPFFPAPSQLILMLNIATPLNPLTTYASTCTKDGTEKH